MDQINPFAHLKAAAGNLGALRLLAQASEEVAVENGDILAAIEALMFARLAATHGEEVDEGRVLSLLVIAGGLCGPGHEFLEQGFQAESVARASLLADNGCQLADDLFPALADSVTPKAIVLSKIYRERLLEARGI